MRVARSVLILCLAFVAIVPVAVPRGASRFDAIVETARRELVETHTPGAAIALVEGDRVVFETGVGVADVETATPVKPEMLFRLGSTTKMFTATALVTLTAEKQILARCADRRGRARLGSGARAPDAESTAVAHRRSQRWRADVRPP